MGEFNVDKTTGGLNPTAGMPETYPATQVMMSDGDSVEDRIEACTYEGFIDISTHTSISNYYTCPADGYVRVSPTTGASARISMLNEDLSDRVGLAESDNSYTSVFCKKGAKIYVENTATAKFISLG